MEILAPETFTNTVGTPALIQGKTKKELIVPTLETAVYADSSITAILEDSFTAAVQAIMASSGIVSLVFAGAL